VPSICNAESARDNPYLRHASGAHRGQRIAGVEVCASSIDELATESGCVRP
jgi:hypothetical protein